MDFIIGMMIGGAVGAFAMALVNAAKEDKHDHSS